MHAKLGGDLWILRVTQQGIHESEGDGGFPIGEDEISNYFCFVNADAAGFVLGFSLVFCGSFRHHFLSFPPVAAASASSCCCCKNLLVDTSAFENDVQSGR